MEKKGRKSTYSMKEIDRIESESVLQGSPQQFLIVKQMNAQSNIVERRERIL